MPFISPKQNLELASNHDFKMLTIGDSILYATQYR